MSNITLKQSTKNVAVNVGAKMIMMLLPFAIRSVIIYTLGTVYLGLDSLFASILNMLSLSELGFSSAIVYSMYKPVAEKDDRKVRALLAFYKKIYFIVGSVIMTAGLAIMPFIEFFIADGTPRPDGINIYIVYLILLINTGLSYFLFAYKSSILVATMRNDVDAVIDLVRSLLSHGLQIVVLVIFQQYYLYIVVLPLITIANNIARSIIIDKRYPQYKGKERLEKADKKDIMTRVGALVGNKIGGVVFISVDSIVISSFLGLTVLGKYTNYYTIFSAVYAIFSTAYTAIQSTVGNNLVRKSKEENYSLFRKLFMGNALLTCFCTCCFAFLFQPFMRLWVGQENLLGLSIPVLFAMYYFTKSTRRICFLFKEAAGMWREDWLKPYVSVICNLAVNILLVKLIGLPGVIISSVFALVFIETPWETAVFFKKYFKRSAAQYIGNVFSLLLRTAVALCIVNAISYPLTNIVSSDILLLLIRTPTCLLATILVYLPTLKNLNLKNIKSLIK